MNFYLNYFRSELNMVIDHFGSKVKTRPVDKDHFQFDAEVSVSPTFFSWIFEFEGMIKIVGPENVEETFHEMVQQVLT